MLVARSGGGGEQRGLVGVGAQAGGRLGLGFAFGPGRKRGSQSGDGLFPASGFGEGQAFGFGAFLGGLLGLAFGCGAFQRQRPHGCLGLQSAARLGGCGGFQFDLPLCGGQCFALQSGALFGLGDGPLLGSQQFHGLRFTLAGGTNIGEFGNRSAHGWSSRMPNTSAYSNPARHRQ